MKTHIVDPDIDSQQAVNVVVAECGEVALIGPDCAVVPTDFDFFSPPHTHRARCEACQREHAAKARHRTMRSGTFARWGYSAPKSVTLAQLKATMEELKKWEKRK